MTLHPIINYSDEDREEFLARCRLLPKRQWQLFDILYTQEKSYASWGHEDGIYVIQSKDKYRFYLDQGDSFELPDDALHLPLEGDLMAMEEWENLKVSLDDDEVVMDWKRACWNMIFKNSRLLSMLRTIQLCYTGPLGEHRQNECEADDQPHNQAGGLVKALHAGLCAGIHAPGEPHLCLDCWRKGEAQ